MLERSRRLLPQRHRGLTRGSRTTGTWLLAFALAIACRPSANTRSDSVSRDQSQGVPPDTINAARFRSGSQFGVALGRDTIWMDSTLLIDAARAIGVPKLAQFEGDTTISIVCARTSEREATYVVMYANSGDRSPVYEISISRVAPRAAPVLASCVALPLTARDVRTTIAGLQLGTKRLTIEAWTGAPAATPSNRVARYILGDSPGLEPDPYQRDRRVILILEYRNGAVVDMDIYRNDRFLDGPCC